MATDPGQSDGFTCDPVLPLVTVSDPDHSEPLARALLSGGARQVEVTLRTGAAVAAISRMAAVPGLTVGAGTVTTPAQLEQVLDAGAAFVVSPGLSVDLVSRCRRDGVPIIPGVATPTEIMRARTEGLRLLKLFPAELLGGVAFVRAVAAPFPDVRFLATGGVGPDSMTGYLQEPAVVAVGGGWMTPAGVVAAEDWNGISDLIADAVGRVPARTTTG